MKFIPTVNHPEHCYKSILSFKHRYNITITIQLVLKIHMRNVDARQEKKEKISMSEQLLRNSQCLLFVKGVKLFLLPSSFISLTYDADGFCERKLTIPKWLAFIQGLATGYTLLSLPHLNLHAPCTGGSLPWVPFCG